MRIYRTLPLIALLAASAATAAPPPVRDFQLPPRPTPTANPQVQGPIDTQGPVPVAPRVISTATPTPTPTPTRTTAATAAPTPTASPRQIENTGSSRPSLRPTPAPVRETVAPASQSDPQTSPATPASPDSASSPTIDGIVPTPAETQGAPIPPAEPAKDEARSGLLGVGWIWWLIGAAVVIAAGAWWWRKGPAASRRPAPLIIPPQAIKDSAGTTGPLAADAEPDLRVEAQAHSLGRSFANATLDYAITLSNLGAQPLCNLRIEADMTTAHSSLPVDQQLASPTTELPDLARIDLLGAGAAKQARGEFRLPVGQLRLIRQGSAHLYVPLLRLRIMADGIEPVLKTFVVGQTQGGRSTRLTPFRIDEMAQVYRNIGLRPLG